MRQGDMRPMKDNPSAMTELKSLLARRESLYAQADLIIKTSTRSPAAIVAEIARATTTTVRSPRLPQMV
jgi:XRE family aerobic/anaerobic benzoate catabolism transcriptional regulator